MYVNSLMQSSLAREVRKVHVVSLASCFTEEQTQKRFSFPAVTSRFVLIFNRGGWLCKTIDNNPAFLNRKIFEDEDRRRTMMDDGAIFHSIFLPSPPPPKKEVQVNKQESK